MLGRFKPFGKFERNTQPDPMHMHASRIPARRSDPNPGCRILVGFLSRIPARRSDLNPSCRILVGLLLRSELVRQIPSAGSDADTTVC